MLVLSRSLVICLSWVGLTEAAVCSSMTAPGLVCPQPGDPEHFTSCCGPEWARKCCFRKGYRKSEIEEFIKKGTEKSEEITVEFLPLPSKPVTSKEDWLLETNSVLQDGKFFNGFLIEISVGVLLVVVLCIVCSIPLIIKKFRRGVSHDQADHEVQQLESHHQEAELHQGVLRPYSARTYQARRPCTPQLHLQHPESPHPGGEAPQQHMNTRLLADTEDVAEDDSHNDPFIDFDFNFSQVRQYFDLQQREALDQALLPYSARTYLPGSHYPHPLPQRPDSPHPQNGANRWMNAQLPTDTEDVDVVPNSYNMSFGQFINFDTGFSPRIHHHEPELHQGVFPPYFARTYQYLNAHPPYPQGTHFFTSNIYNPDPPPAYPGPHPRGDVVDPQLFADFQDDDDDDYLPSYDEAVGQS